MLFESFLVSIGPDVLVRTQLTLQLIDLVTESTNAEGIRTGAQSSDVLIQFAICSPELAPLGVDLVFRESRHLRCLRVRGWPPSSLRTGPSSLRSEERRVGKECRFRWLRQKREKKIRRVSMCWVRWPRS